MGRHPDVALRVSEGQATPLAGDGVVPDRSREISETSVKSLEHRRLAAGGWIPRLRMGKIIWVSPQTGCWYSAEMPLQLLRLDEGSPGGSA